MSRLVGVFLHLRCRGRLQAVNDGIAVCLVSVTQSVTLELRIAQDWLQMTCKSAGVKLLVMAAAAGETGDMGEAYCTRCFLNLAGLLTTGSPGSGCQAQ